jgi:hypothetical protein
LEAQKPAYEGRPAALADLLYSRGLLDNPQGSAALRQRYGEPALRDLAMPSAFSAFVQAMNPLEVFKPWPQLPLGERIRTARGRPSLEDLRNQLLRRLLEKPAAPP